MSSRRRQPAITAQVLPWLVFPGVLTGSLLSAWLMWRAGLPVEVIMITSTVSVLVLLFALQARLPWERDWRWDTELGLDLAHMFLSNGLANVIVKALLFGTMAGVAVKLAALHEGLVWPHAWPVLVQLLVAMAMGELCFYWAHRLAHEHPLLWRVHAIHHSSAELTVLSAVRNHPLNAVVSFFCQTGPAVMLGVGEETLLLLSVFTTTHGMLQHANIATRTGWLGLIFATVDIHRWHHSVVLVQSSSNYGSNLMLWDHIFGSFQHPASAGPRAVGMEDIAIPPTYLDHLLAPLRWHTLKRPVPQAQAVRGDPSSWPLAPELLVHPDDRPAAPSASPTPSARLAK